MKWLSLKNTFQETIKKQQENTKNPDGADDCAHQW